ncbi:MAG: tetraacyldisaccharide 4'-kinase [Candidatus Omnitrophica bacterium]|nr:tetraacyldisaccharide 4'-kinase [Candidatus Omnitrophota bacterium]
MALTTKEKIKRYFLEVITGKKKGICAFLLRDGLLFSALIYGVVLNVWFFLFRYRLIKAKKSKIKVISVGNITLGGTGKTPLVEMIARRLIRNNIKTAIISRGYKGRKNSAGLFIADEIQTLKNELKQVQVIVDSNRLRAIARAQDTYGCRAVVLDDAFGRLEVKKDLDIVCIDSGELFGNGRILPAGILRLPLKFLERADVFVLTNIDPAKMNCAEIEISLRKHNPHAQIYKARHVPSSLTSLQDGAVMDLTQLRDKKVALLCGIAKPENFERTVQQLGAEVSLKFYFPDHHCYRRGELENAIDTCRRDSIKYLIITSKDEPKIAAADVLGAKNSKTAILTLKIKLELIEDEDKFFNRIC